MNLSIPSDFQEQLIKYTCEHSQHDSIRNYISLSHSTLNVTDIVEQYFNGFNSDVVQKLKCYKGYQMEADLINRIVAIYGDRITLNYEISAFDGLVKGHPDFLIDGYPCDAKSVLRDDWLPVTTNTIPDRAYYQIQAYMYYMKQSQSLLVYESRESGLIKTYKVFSYLPTQDFIHRKNMKAVDIIKQRLQNENEKHISETVVNLTQQGY